MPNKYPITNFVVWTTYPSANEVRYNVQFDVSNLLAHETLTKDPAYVSGKYTIFPFRIITGGAPSNPYSNHKKVTGSFPSGHTTIALITYEDNGKVVIEAEAMATHDGEPILK